MFVSCILAGTHVHTWYKSMRKLYRRITKPPASGQAPKVLTARQCWVSSNFKFLASHLTIRTAHSQLRRVLVPATVSVVDGGDDDDDAISVSSIQVPSQVATSSHPPVTNHMTPGPPGHHLVVEERTMPFSRWWSV